MKRIYQFILLTGTILGMSWSTYAQQKIGNNLGTLNPGAVLELESTNRGFLPSRVSLSASNVWSLNGTATNGMLVYNTNTATGANAVTPGFYMWQDGSWVRIVTGAGTTTNALTYAPTTRTLTSNVNGVSADAVLPLATASVTGLLSSTDFTTFNTKENPLTFSNGLTRTANNITLGGTLTGNTALTLADRSFTFGGVTTGKVIVSGPEGSATSGLQLSNLMAAVLPATSSAGQRILTVDGNGNVILGTDFGSNNAGTVTNVSGTAPISVATGTTTPVISINSLGITTGLLADAAVTTPKIADAAVTTPKIADAAVTLAKLAPSGTAGQVLTSSGGSSAPTWTTLPTATNIYTANGTINEARNVTLNNNSLTFLGVGGSQRFTFNGSNGQLNISGPTAGFGFGDRVRSRRYEWLGVNGIVSLFTDHTPSRALLAIDSTNTMYLPNVGSRFGIGTATPSTALEIATSQGQGIFVRDNSVTEAAPVIRVQGMRNDGNGSSAFSGGLALQHFRSDAAVGGNSALGNVYFGGNHTNATEGNMLYAASIGGLSENTFTAANQMPTALVFRTGNTGTTLTAISHKGDERMRITSTGNVGIGTNAPSAQFHTTGSVRLQGLAGTGSRMVVTDADGNLSAQALPTSSVTNVTGTAPINVATGTTTPVISINALGITTGLLADAAVTTPKIADAAVTTPKIADAAVTLAKLAPSGTAGQVLTSNGGSSAPTWTTLPTANNIYNADGTIVGGNRTVAMATNSLTFTSTATTGSNHFSVDGSTFSVDAVNNRVGIGTSSPGTPLEVNLSTAGTIATFAGLNGGLWITNPLGQGAFNSLVSAGDRGLIFTNDLAPGTPLNGFVIAPWASSAMTGLKIMENGNVGINVDNPTSRVHLGGSVANSILRITAATTLNESHHTIIANAFAAGYAITLPAPNTCAGRVYVIRKVDESSNAITFTFTGITGSNAIRVSDTSATAGSYINSLNYTKTLRIQSDGTNWYLID
ncbi:MAG: beta strand repeat-containing protein [Spirosomataceae bacterium]